MYIIIAIKIIDGILEEYYENCANDI